MQPSLDEVAAHVGLSPAHFQRLFSRWAGVSPKRFLQTITVERAKELLRESHSILSASQSVGLSASSRLYDHFVELEAVTPGEYKRRGEGLDIDYGFHPTPFGDSFIAQTPRGICAFAFFDDEAARARVDELKARWPGATVRENKRTTRATMSEMFSRKPDGNKPLSLHVTGTNFQVSVWKALLQIPTGGVTTYGALAKAVGSPKSARAIGGAVGANPVALLIPCHRVIQASGSLGGFRWGLVRKQAMQGWERSR